jgi:hypothetical protein
MTLTPLHVAFIWVLKPRFGKLHFAALTVGAVIPDVEPLIAWMFGWSVFCGWDFPCSLAPDRLVLHSIVGAITIDVVLTIIFLKMIGKLDVEGWGYVDLPMSRQMPPFFASAAIGSLSHIFVNTRLSCPFISTYLYYYVYYNCNNNNSRSGCHQNKKQAQYLMPLSF